MIKIESNCSSKMTDEEMRYQYVKLALLHCAEAEEKKINA